MLVLYGLPHIGIKGALCHISVDFDLGIVVALAQDPTLALLYVAGPPGDVQMVQGDQPFLYVGSRTHLGGAPEKDTHLSGADVGKELRFAGLSVRFVDERDLLLRDAALDQLLPQVVVHVEIPVVVGRGQVAEHQLGGTLFAALLPYPVDVVQAGVDLALFVIREHGVIEPLIQRQLPAVVGDFKHIILAWLHLTVPDFLSPVCEGGHHLLLILAGLYDLIVVLCLWHRKVKHIRRLHVGDVLEHGHQLRKIEKTGEPGLCPIARSLGGQLDGRHRFPECRRPAVKMLQVDVLQALVLEVSLHGVHLGHGVADGRTRSEHHAVAVCDLIQIPALHVEVGRLLCLCLGYARDVPHLGIQKQVLVVVCFVDEQAVHAKLLEGHHVVFPFLTVQSLQPCFQPTLRLFHLLYGVPCAVFRRQRFYTRRDFLDLILNRLDLSLNGYGDLLELAVADDHGVIVAGGNPTAKPFAVLLFKVLPGRHQDVRRWVQLQKLAGPLLRQVVRNHEQRLMAKAQAFQLHGRRRHLKGLSRAHHMG